MAVEYGGTLATESKQTDGNSSLASIDGKLNSLGQKTMANSVPVVIASDQTIVINADTSGLATAAKQPALGTAGTASANVITVQGIASMTAIKTDGSAVTQPVSGTVTANAGSGTFAVSGPLTDTQLRASAVPISAAALPLPSGASTEATLSTLNGKVPSNLTVSSTRLLVDPSGVTQPVSAAALPLPSGASTSALQTTTNTSLSTISTTLSSILTRLGAIMANVTTSGNVSLATDHVVLDCDGLGTAMVRITGTFTGTINFYASVKASPDPTADTDYFGAAGSSYIDLSGQVDASTNHTGVWAFNLAGLTQLRFRPAGGLTGTATIEICGSPGAAVPVAISSIVFTSV